MAQSSGSLAEAMGDPFKRYISTLLPRILSNLADAKVLVLFSVEFSLQDALRATAAATLSAIAKVCGINAVLENVGTIHAFEFLIIRVKLLLPGFKAASRTSRPT
jgi:hypothetical protein